jgi:hypothetical protein
VDGLERGHVLRLTVDLDPSVVGTTEGVEQELSGAAGQGDAAGPWCPELMHQSACSYAGSIGRGCTHPG